LLKTNLTINITKFNLKRSVLEDDFKPKVSEHFSDEIISKTLTKLTEIHTVSPIPSINFEIDINFKPTFE